MRLTLIFILFLLCTSAFGQKLIYKSDSIKSFKTDTTVFDIHPNVLSNKLVLQLKDKREKVIKSALVWGYENNEHQIFRYYNAQFFLIADTGKIIIYDNQEDKNKRKEANHYFSFGLDGNMYLLTKKSIKHVFRKNKCFMNKIHKLHTNGLIKNRTELNRLYNDCK